MTEQFPQQPPFSQGGPSHGEPISARFGSAGYGGAGYGGAGFGGAGFGGAGGNAHFIVTGPIEPGSEASLRRYLLTRALGRSVIQTVQWSGIAILVIAALCWLGGAKVLGILIGLMAIAALVLRALLSGVERRLTGSARLGAVEPRVAKLVARTGRSMRRELRRVGLPGTPWAPVLIAVRLIRPTRRAQTAKALSQVSLDSIVPANQLDELHLLLQQSAR